MLMHRDTLAPYCYSNLVEFAATVATSRPSTVFSHSQHIDVMDAAWQAEPATP